MSVNLCDRCGDVTVDAELCRCAEAAASLSAAAQLPEAAELFRTAAPSGTDSPGQPAPAGLAPVEATPSRAA